MSYYYVLENGQPMDGQFYVTDAELDHAVEYADAMSRIIYVGEADGKPTIRDLGTAETWRACLEDERREYQAGLAAERASFYSHANRGTGR